MDAVAGVLAAGCAVLVFGVVAFRLDDGDLRAILERLRQMTWFQPFNSLLQRVGTAGRVRAMNIENQQSGTGESRRHARLMTARERQGALGIGVAAGIAGGFAVFNSSNQAGTAVLLLISLVFLLAGVEGTPLLRIRGGLSSEASGRRRAGKARLDDIANGTGLGATERAVDPDVARRNDTASYDDRIVAALTDERQH